MLNHNQKTRFQKCLNPKPEKWRKNLNSSRRWWSSRRTRGVRSTQATREPCGEEQRPSRVSRATLKQFWPIIRRLSQTCHQQARLQLLRDRREKRYHRQWLPKTFWVNFLNKWMSKEILWRIWVRIYKSKTRPKPPPLTTGSLNRNRTLRSNNS